MLACLHRSRLTTQVVFFCTHVQFSFLFHKKLLELSFSKDFCVNKLTLDLYSIKTFEVKLVGKHTENY